MDSNSSTPVGVLLVNLGTPAAPTAQAIRPWLRAFLSDRRVVNLPRLLWWPILYGLILPLRPRKLVEAYESIWTDQGSPLQVISKRQAEALQMALPEGHLVQAAMTYGQPAIADGLRNLEQAGCQRIIVLPLYPQYSDTTTAAVFDRVAAAEPRVAVKTIHDYHAEPAYIAALAKSVRAHWEKHGRGDRLLLSLHGIPQRNVDLGDPYASQCQTTARLLAAALELQDNEWLLAYQSRVGRAQWLQPYTDEALAEWGRRGVGTVDVLCPGFAADCLETLEEIAIRNRKSFIAAGGRELRYIPALNDRQDHIKMLSELVLEQTRGWQKGYAAKC